MPDVNKWDYEYTIGQLRPDVVADFRISGARLIEQLDAWGYACQANGLFGRRDSSRIDWTLIAREWKDARGGKVARP